MVVGIITGERKRERRQWRLGDEKKIDGIRWISVYVNLLISALGFIFTMCHTSMH
jgi:hypothetical protein